MKFANLSNFIWHWPSEVSFCCCFSLNGLLIWFLAPSLCVRWFHFFVDSVDLVAADFLCNTSTYGAGYYGAPESVITTLYKAFNVRSSVLRLSFYWHAAAIHIDSETASLTRLGWIPLVSAFEFQRYIVFGFGSYNLVRFLVNSYWIIGSWWLKLCVHLHGMKERNLILLMKYSVLVCHPSMYHRCML